MTGHAIVLNGPSSVGKSSIVRAMLTMLPGAHPVAMDDYLAALPAASFGTPAGLTFIPRCIEGVPSTEVVAGPLVQAALARMRSDVAVSVTQGRHVIVDDVMLAADDEAAYRRLIQKGAIAFVAVRAPLPVVEVRERQRGDRVLGLARWQFDRVHEGRTYDMDVDTSQATPDEIAATIFAELGWPDPISAQAPLAGNDGAQT